MDISELNQTDAPSEAVKLWEHWAANEPGTTKAEKLEQLLLQVIQNESNNVSQSQMTIEILERYLGSEPLSSGSQEMLERLIYESARLGVNQADPDQYAECCGDSIRWHLVGYLTINRDVYHFEPSKYYQQLLTVHKECAYHFLLEALKWCCSEANAKDSFSSVASMIYSGIDRTNRPRFY